eukprot:1197224-Prorocentrum_lima.AAC.1
MYALLCVDWCCLAYVWLATLDGGNGTSWSVSEVSPRSGRPSATLFSSAFPGEMLLPIIASAVQVGVSLDGMPGDQ